MVMSSYALNILEGGVKQCCYNQPTEGGGEWNGIRKGHS